MINVNFHLINQNQRGFPLHFAFILGQTQRSIIENPSIQIKKEIDEDELEMKPEVHVSMPCPICGMGETGTHNHYGGRACTSCRAFFRRSVQTNSYKVPIIAIEKTRKIVKKCRQQYVI